MKLVYRAAVSLASRDKLAERGLSSVYNGMQYVYIYPEAGCGSIAVSAPGVTPEAGTPLFKQPRQPIYG